MKRLFRFIVFLGLVGGWTLAASTLHLVRTDEKKFVLVPKNRIGFEDTYVDTRKWTLDDVRKHPAVVERLIAIDKSDLLANIATSGHGTTRQQLQDAVDHPTINKEPARTPMQQMEDKVKSQLNAATQGVTSMVDVN